MREKNSSLRHLTDIRLTHKTSQKENRKIFARNPKFFPKGIEMARFDQTFIDGLKKETDIVRLIESYGARLKDRGGSKGEMIGLCPIHDDKNPSLVVNRNKNVWNCLGACGKGGDVIQWVMHAEKASFRHAVELLRDGATGGRGGEKRTTAKKLDSPLADKKDESELLASIADFYHQRLKESPDALDYLQRRCITDSETIDRFKIGFVDRTLGLRLPAKQIKAGAEIRTRLKDIGILRDTGHEHLRGCITFPLYNQQGQVAQIYGRRIDNGGRKKIAHFYLPRPHGGVLNLDALKATDEIILCESVIDALTFWDYGYRNVTTAFGTNGFTDELHSALIANNIKRILIAYDSDEAGEKAADELAAKLLKDNFELFRIKLTKSAGDINNYAQIAAKGEHKNDNAKNWLGLLIRNATWLGKGTAPELTTQLPDIFQGKTELTPETAKEENVSDVPPSNDHPTEATESVTPSLATTNGSVASLEVTSSSKASSLAADAAGESEPQTSPVPAAPQEVEAKVGEKEITIEIGNRSYRVRGLAKNLAFEVLKVNVLVRRDDRFYVDTFDLYAARARNVFIKEASHELGFEPETIKRDLGKVLFKLESLQDQNIEDTLAVKEDKIELSDKDKQAALELLQQPNLIQRILDDFAACGVVGEETNKLVGYLAATSRKLQKPLAVVIQSSSAAGKSSLMDAILRFVPSEEQVGYSAMTGQSLFYMGGMELKNKILSIAEEEGVAQASYALKLLQSEGELTIASTGKDPGTGRMETQEYHVEGPVMIFLTTTAIDIDEELLNRCVVLTVDENRDQTRAIHDQQRKNETLAGLLASQGSSSIRKLHQNAQRLLRPLLVVNPFADELSFIDDRARRRRDHMKYLTLIRSIALLHQYQREIKTAAIGDESVQYIEVQMADIVLANRLADQILGRSIDELPPQTRRMLIELHELVGKQCQAQELKQSEYRFTRRFVRENLGWGQSQVKLHLDRLMEMEYVIPHRGGGRRTEYELLYDGRGREGQPTMCGLIDVAKLTTTTKPSSGLAGRSSGQTAESSGSDRPVIGPSSQPVATATLAESNGKPR